MPPRRPTAQPVSGAIDNPSVEPDDSIEIDAVSALLDSIEDPSGQEVMVYELSAEGRQMLARSGLADFDVWEFADRFGGGNYEMRLRDVRTKQMGTSRRFSVSKRVPRKDTTAAAAAPSGQASPDTSSVFAMMMQMVQLQMQQAQAQQQQQTAVLTALIGRPQTDNLAQVIQAAQMLAGKNDTTPIGELLEGVERIQKMSGGTVAGGASDEVELAKAFAPAIVAMFNRPAQAAQHQHSHQPTPAALPAPQTTPAQAAAADTHPATTPPLAAPSPIINGNDDRMQNVSAAIDTITGIIITAGLNSGGIIGSDETAAIARQIWRTIDLDVLGDVLEVMKSADLAAHIVERTPAILREQMQQHTAAIRQIGHWLQETHEAAQPEDDDGQDADTPSEATHEREAEPVAA